MLIICVFLCLLLTWCQCDDQSAVEGKQYDDNNKDQNEQSARLHHFGHYGRIIASPTGITDLAEESPMEDESSSESKKPSDLFSSNGRQSTKNKLNKHFHQAIQYIPRRRWDHHQNHHSHLDEYHHKYQLYPYHHVHHQQQQFERRGYEDFHLFNGHGQYGGMDRSDFYYVLPILLVIGLGAFLIPIITTFFTALVTSNTALCGRRKRNDHFVVDWKPLLHEKVLEMWTTVERAFQAGLQKYGNNSGANSTLNQQNNHVKNITSNTNNGGRSNHFFNS